jgi:hypothetical protein
MKSKAILNSSMKKSLWAINDITFSLNLNYLSIKSFVSITEQKKIKGRHLAVLPQGTQPKLQVSRLKPARNPSIPNARKCPWSSEHRNVFKMTQRETTWFSILGASPSYLKQMRSLAFELDRIWRRRKSNRKQKIQIISNIIKILQFWYVSKYSYPWTATWLKPCGWQKTSLPKRISRIMTNDSLSNLEIQILMSLLAKHRTLNDYIRVNIKDIVVPVSKDNAITNTIMLLSVNWNKLRLPFIPFKQIEHTCQYRETSGPNGPYSWLTSIYDSIAVSKNIKILNSIDRLAQLVFNNHHDWRKLLDSTIHYSRFFVEDRKNFLLRKLTPIADYAGKTRVIAIGDYYSQEVLRPLHQHLFKMLEKTNGDSTFDTNKSIAQIKKWHQEGHKTWSYDLSAATDRFPALITKKIISWIFTEEISDLWYSLMVKDVSYYLPQKGMAYKYAVGQPMGLYSSWAAFSVSHHAIVRLLEVRLGLVAGENYVLLGDDITLINEKLASEYVRLLSSIGVKISIPKSLIPNETVKFQAEFAKRLIVNGIEVSSMPLRLLKGRNDHLINSSFLAAILLRWSSWNSVSVDRVVSEFNSETILAALLQFKDDFLVKEAIDKMFKAYGINKGPLLPVLSERSLVPCIDLPVQFLKEVAYSYLDSIPYTTHLEHTSFGMQRLRYMMRSFKLGTLNWRDPFQDNVDFELLLNEFIYTTPYGCLYDQILTKAMKLPMSPTKAIETSSPSAINGLDDLRSFLKLYEPVRSYRSMLSNRRKLPHQQSSKIASFLLIRIPNDLTLDELKILFNWRLSNPQLHFDPISLSDVTRTFDD